MTSRYRRSCCTLIVLLLLGVSHDALSQGTESVQGLRLVHPASPTTGISLIPPTGIVSYSLTFPSTQGSAGTVLTNNGSGVLTWSTPSGGWSLTGNAGTSATTNFLGTTDAVDLVLRTNNTERMRIQSGGTVAIAGNLTLGTAGANNTTATPINIDLGSTAASDLNPLKAKIKLYNNGTDLYGFGITAFSLNSYVGSGASFRWYHGGGATPTEIMSLSTSRLAMPATVDLSIKGVAYTWPTANGAAGTVLTNNGSGTLTWSAASSGWGLTGNASTNASTNFIGTTDAIDFVVRTNNTERMRVLSGGNVGIGTNNPATRLHVSDNAAASSSGQPTFTLTGVMNAPTPGSGPSIVFREVTTGTPAASIRAYTFGNSATGLAFATGWNAVADRMVIDNTGNVGIGTTTPGTRLTVSGTGSSNTGAFSIITTGADVFNWASQAINSSMSAGRNLIHLIGQATSTNNAGYMGFSYAGASSTSNGLTFGFFGNDRLFNMLASGNMGIGTTTPSEKLTVMNGNMYLDNTGTAGELRFREPSGSGTNYTAFRAGAQAANLTYTLPTTAPTAGQLLSSDASGNLSWASAGASGWGLTGNASTNATTNFIGTTDAIDFVVRTNNTERMRVLGGGNVTLGGALGGGTPTAAPVTLSLGSTFASSVTASQAKLRIFENSAGTEIYGIGVSSSQMNYFVGSSASHRWYVNNAETMWLSSTLLAVPSANMAIGASSSTERLTVSGNIALTGSINLAGTAGAPGTPSVLAQQTTSGANTWIYRESGFPAWGVYHYNTDDASAVQNSWMFMNGNSVGWSNTSFTSIPAGTAASIVLQNQTGNAYFAGNIGINTTAPTARLHVTGGNIFLDNAGTAGELRFREPSGSGTNYTAFRAGAQAANLTYTLPLSAPTAGQVLSSDASGNLSWTSPAGAAWGLTGNGGTNASTNYIGTTDAVDFVIRTAALERMRVLAGGNVTIGGALGGGTSTATPVTLTLGSTFADAPTSNKAKLRIFEASIAGYVYGFGVSDSRLNYFVPSGATHRWYIGDVLTKTLDNTGFMTLVGSTPGVGTDAATDLLLRTNSAERIRITSGGNVTIGGALGGGTPTAAPVTLTLGSTFADAPTSNKAKLRIFESSSAGSVYGLGVSASQFNYFSPSGTTHRWYIGDVEQVSLSSTAATKLTVTNGNIYLDNTGTAGELRFREPSASGANYTAFRAGAQAADLTYTLPLTAPTAGQILSSDASGNLSWTSPAASGWGLTGNATTAGSYAPALNAATSLNSVGDKGSWIGTQNSQPLWFATNNTYRASIAVDGTFTMSGPLVINNLSSTAGTTLPAGYDRVLIGNASGQIEEVGFTAFADATNTGWGINGNTTSAGSYAPVLNAATSLNSVGDKGPWIGTRNAQPLWFATNNTYRASIAVDGTFTMSGPLVINNLSSTARTTLPAGYDRVLIGNASGQIEEVGFTAFADATNTGWGINGNTTSAGSYAPALNAATSLNSVGDKGPWIGTRNAQPLWFATNNTYRASIAVDGTFTMSGPLVINNLSSTAGTTLPAGYDRVLIGNASGQIEEVGFTAFADATNTGWGINGNTTSAGSYAPVLNAATSLNSVGDKGPWIGTRNAQPLWFATNNTYRASIAVDGTFTMSGPLVINNLSSTAGTTLPAGYDRVLIGNASGQIEEVGFTAFADATNTGWGINGNTTSAGSYAPALNAATSLNSVGDKGPWIGTRNAQPLWFATNNTYRASIAVDGTFTMSGPLVINNLSSTAGTTLPAGYDRVLIGNASGQIEEVGFTAFADATNTGWGINGNTTSAGSYAPALNAATSLNSVGDKGPWIGTRNAQPLWFATNNTYRASIAVDGTFTMSGPLVIDNLNSTAAATISAGYDRVLVANSSGRVEEVSFATFANASASGWGTTGNEPAAGAYSPALGATTSLNSVGDKGSWIGTRNARDLWFGTNNVYRAVIRSTGELALSGQAQFAAGTAAAPSVSREGDTDNGMFFPAANTLAFSTGATERVRVTDIGRVGIGNAAPAYVLDVTGDINSSTNVRAAGTALTSDKRLKRNVEPIDSALFLVNKLKPVRFEKKAAVDDTLYQWKQMGFIAQELQTVFPELVQIGADKQKTMSVDYTSLIALLTSAVQEQQAVIQDQDQRIRTLSTLLQNLEARIRALEGNSGEKTR